MSAVKTRTPGTLSIRALHEEQPQEGKDFALARRLFPFVRPHAALVIVALVSMPIVALVSVVQPYLIKRAIDAVVVLQSSEALTKVVVLFAAALTAEFLVRFVQTYTMQLAGQRAMAGLRSKVFEHIQGLRLSYFDRTPSGRTVTRVTNDIDSLSELFASGAVTAFGDVLMLAGIVSFMLYLDWQLSLVAFASLPPLALLVGGFRKYARDAFRLIRARISELNAFLAEQVNGIVTIQSFGREARCAQEYRDINASHRDANRQAIKYDALLYSVVESIATASIAVVLWYAARQAGLLGGGASGATTSGAEAGAYVGTVIAFYEYIQRFFVPIRDLSTKYTIIQSSLAAAERVFSLLDLAEPDAPAWPEYRAAALAAAPAAAGAPAISIRGLNFEYRPGVPVLRGIDLDIAKGETIAVVGATGSGKTTIASLLVRLYEFKEGSIRFHGHDLRGMDRTDLRRRFAVVPQDVFLFAGTVLENIVVGAPVQSRERALAVLENLGVREFLESRGHGIDSDVQERGGNLSSGERQLVALARALYRDPEVVVLDEATANVDSETELVLADATARFLEGRTAIVIAHRLSTVREAGRIVVMHHGQIVEQGPHDALLGAGGVYARLHALHFAGAAAE